MSTLTCNRCGGTGLYFGTMQCARCNGKGMLTAVRIKHLMESYYPRKLATGAISREVFTRHLFELREMLGRLGAPVEELGIDTERIAKAVPLDAAMCAKHGITHSSTMLEMKKKFPSIYVEEF